MKHSAYEPALQMVQAGVPPFLVGPAGSGKTTIGKNIAADLDLPFYYTGAVESSFQLRGFKDAHGNTVKTPFRTAYEDGGIFLFDELDASDPQAIVSLHAALDNGVLDAPDGMIPRHPDFHYLAAGNTWGHGASLQYMGRNALDGATLDRYAYINVDYDPELEKDLVRKLVGEDQLKWVNVIHITRKAVFDLEMRHIVSTRAAINGAKLLKSGMSIEEVFNCVVLKGMDKDQATQLTERIDFEAGEIDTAIDTDRLENLRETMSRVSGISERLNEAENQLDDIHSKASEISDDTLEQMEKVGKQLQKASQSLGEIKSSVKLLKSFNESTPAVIEAAQAALQELTAGPS